MKIVVDYQQTISDLQEIKSAKYIGDYAISIVFTDGYSRVVDFKSFLERSQHPSIRQYIDEQKFKQFNIVDGNLNWNNYDLIFPIYDLYTGQI